MTRCYLCLLERGEHVAKDDGHECTGRCDAKLADGSGECFTVRRVRFVRVAECWDESWAPCRNADAHRRAA